jgi:hypothetical protein
MSNFRSLEIWFHCQDWFELFRRRPGFCVDAILGNLVDALERVELLLRDRPDDCLPVCDLPVVDLFLVVRLTGCFAKDLASN